MSQVQRTVTRSNSVCRFFFQRAVAVVVLVLSTVAPTRATPPRGGEVHAQEITLLLEAAASPPGRSVGSLTSQVCDDNAGAYEKSECEAAHLSHISSWKSKLVVFNAIPTEIIFERTNGTFKLSFIQMLANFPPNHNQHDEYQWSTPNEFEDHVIFSTRRTAPPPTERRNILREAKAVTKWLSQLSELNASFEIQVDEQDAATFEDDLEILFFAVMKDGPHARRYRYPLDIGPFTEVLFEPVAIYVSSKSDRANANVARSKWFGKKQQILKKLATQRAEMTRKTASSPDNVSMPEPAVDSGIVVVEASQITDAGRTATRAVLLGSLENAIAAEAVLHEWRGRQVRVFLVNGRDAVGPLNSFRNLRIAVGVQTFDFDTVEKVELIDISN